LVSRKQKQKTGSSNDINISEEPKPEKVLHRKEGEKQKLIEELLERCGDILNLVVCEGDRVNVKAGRYWWSGEVLKIGKPGLVLDDHGKKVAINIGKITSVTILEEGKQGKKYREIFGTVYRVEEKRSRKN